MLTTASDRVVPRFLSNRLLQGLATLFALVWLVTAISPVNRFDWFLENLLVFVTVGLLSYFYRTRPLSDLSYILITIFLMLHTVGSHYTYSEVPLGFWLQDSFSLDRNHFDRIVHFCFGVLIFYPAREILFRYMGAGFRLSGFVAFAVIATSSTIFEIIEWIVAIVVSPEAAMAYLGTQGDIFDAQKDSALAISGTVFGLLLTRRFIKPRQTDSAD